MYTAVANVKVTPAYWEALMQNPDSDRAAAIAQAMASVGGKCISSPSPMGSGMPL